MNPNHEIVTIMKKKMNLKRSNEGFIELRNG
jgi:hypothetical protein